MHYIIGTEIPSNQRGVSVPQGRSQSVGQPQLTRQSYITDQLNSDVGYSLYHIYKKEDEFVYVFAESDSGKKVEIVFKTPRDADVYIARLLGDKLPKLPV